jgi:hypothetical protein
MGEDEETTLKKCNFLMKLGLWQMFKKFVILTIHQCHKSLDFDLHEHVLYG